MSKFGLFQRVHEDNGDLVSDKTLANDFFHTLNKVGGDYTNCFRKLSILCLPGMDNFDECFEKLRKELLLQSSTHDELVEQLADFINCPMVSTRLILFQTFHEQLKDDEKTKQILNKLEHYKHLTVKYSSFSLYSLHR